MKRTSRKSSGRGLVSLCPPENQLDISEIPKDLLFVFLWLCAEPNKTPFDQEESPDSFRTLLAYFKRLNGQIGEWVTRRRIALSFEADSVETDLYADANGSGAAELALTLTKAFVEEFGNNEADWEKSPFWTLSLGDVWLKENQLQLLARLD